MIRSDPRPFSFCFLNQKISPLFVKYPLIFLMGLWVSEAYIYTVLILVSLFHSECRIEKVLSALLSGFKIIVNTLEVPNSF